MSEGGNMQGSVQEQPSPVTRRVLDIEDYVHILRRHRSWILGPAFLGLVIGVVIAFLWPDTFMASGQMRVVPPRVPSRLVASNMSEEMSQRVNAIYQGIVSRTSLTNLIQTHNLYPDKRKRLPMEDVIDGMRKDILVSPLKNLSTGATGHNSVFAFTISYAYSDRRLAAKVCSDLISKFMEESVTSRSSQSQETTMFFKEEADAAKQALDGIDAKIASFKSSNSGILPDEANSLIMSVSTVESSISNLNMNLSRASGEKIQLESQLHFLKEQLASVQPGVAATGSTETGAAPAPIMRDERLAQLEAEVNKLESAVSALRETYKETHPDVQRALTLLGARKRELDQYAAKLASMKPAEVAARAGAASNPSRTLSRELQGRIAGLQAAVQAKDMEIEDLNHQLAAGRNRSKNLQAKVEASPLARSGYVALMRDREGAAQRYEDLDKRLQESSMATNLETRKQGETLEVLEEPVIPIEPNAPKRPLIIAIAAAVGLLLGFGLAFGREIKDVSLKSLKDVRAYTRLTVLGSIPLLENDFVVRRRSRTAWLGWSASLLIGVLIMSGAVVYYYTAKS
jgi:polysaccharide chain length determinant protein (PEP-CTERM system associated)